LLNKHGGKAIRNFGLTIAAFAIGSWLLFYHIYETNQALAYFSMPPRFWELAAGCLIYLIYTTKAANYVRKYIHALILLILLVVALSLPQQVGSPVFRVTAVVLLTSLLILVVRKGSLTHSLLSNKLFVFIGIISYSLYLWHWPILSLSRLTIGVHYFTIPAQLLLIFALASLTFYKIETPFRSGNRGYGFMDFHPLSKVLYAGLAVSAAMLFLAYKASHRIYVGRILNVDYPIWIRKPWFAGANGLGIDVCSSGTEITVQQAQDCLKLNPKSLTTAYVIGGQCPFVWCKTFGPNALIRG
jgi:peptidoglycan/LPS O-acetylase OafA/YrhL